jgi:hypothetical protein
MNRLGQIPDHGTASRYHGSRDVPPCRCRPCTDRVVRDDALRHLDRLAGRPRRVPSESVRAHVLALHQRNLSYEQIARAAGTNATNVRCIADGRRQKITKQTAEQLLAVPLTWIDPNGPVDSIGTVRRLQALYAIGVSVTTIVEQTRLDNASILHLVRGDWARIDRKRADQVRTAYDRLWLAPGNSVKTRLRARREGWAGPLHWNDESIDDPAGFPDWTGACGTLRGYRRHHRNRNVPGACQPCRDAKAADRTNNTLDYQAA